MEKPHSSIPLFDTWLELTWIDLVVYSIQGVLAIGATILNGFILWVLCEVSNPTHLDIIQMNLVFSDVLHGLFGSLFIIASRFFMVFEPTSGIKMFMLSLTFVFVQVEFEDLVTILVIILRTKQGFLTKR